MFHTWTNTSKTLCFQWFSNSGHVLFRVTFQIRATLGARRFSDSHASRSRRPKKKSRPDGGIVECEWLTCRVSRDGSPCASSSVHALGNAHAATALQCMQAVVQCDELRFGECETMARMKLAHDWIGVVVRHVRLLLEHRIAQILETNLLGTSPTQMR